MLPDSFYRQPALGVAAELLGCELVHTTKEGITSGIIVETEAYHQSDEASHSFRGMTPRTEVMFGPGGHAYVYFTYGMHYCFNVVAGDDTTAEAVLIRALEPKNGLELMEQRRKTTDLRNLCSGPAKLVQAMGIVKQENGVSLTQAGFHIRPRTDKPPIIMTSPRVGITRATDKQWRFMIKDNPYISSSPFNKVALPFIHD